VAEKIIDFTLGMIAMGGFLWALLSSLMLRYSMRRVAELEAMLADDSDAEGSGD
jgi:hypothetical protein